MSDLRCTVCGSGKLSITETDSERIECEDCRSEWYSNGAFAVEGPHRVQLGDWVLVRGYQKGEVQEVRREGYTVHVVEPRSDRCPFIFAGRRDVVKLDRRPFLVGDKVRRFNSGDVGIVTGLSVEGVRVHLARSDETVYFTPGDLDFAS